MSLEEWLFLYQNLRLLVTEYNKVYGVILVGTKICFISFAMFGAYGAFRTTRALAIFLFSCGIFSVCFLVLYMMLLGEVYDRSKEFLSMGRKNRICPSKFRLDAESVLWLRKYLQVMRK